MTNLQMLRKLPARDVAILISTIIEEGICSFCVHGRENDSGVNCEICSEPTIKGTNLKDECVQGLHRWLNQEAERHHAKPAGHRSHNDHRTHGR